MHESKFLEKKQKQPKQLKKILVSFFTRILLTVVAVLILLIGFKMNKNFKTLFYQQVYQAHFPFAEMKKMYQKYFGNTLSLKGLEVEEKTVFDEKISYKSKSLYQDGVKLEVSSNYMVPTLESGIVVFIGEKEGYGNTVIVQQVNGIDTWYGNIQLSGVKLYDYVEKGKLLGEVVGKKFYLAFQKEGVFQDYQNYLS